MGKVDTVAMAILVVDDVLEVTAYGTIGGRAWASVWGMTNGAGLLNSGTEIEEVVRDFADNFQDHILLALCSSVSLSGYRYLSLNSSDGQTGLMAPSSGKRTSGANTDAALPPNCAFLVRKQGSGGRGARSGRAYLPGVPEGVVDNEGNIDAGLIDDTNGHLQAFLDGVSDTGNSGGNRYPVIVHRPPGAREPGPQVVQGSSTRITSLTVDPRLGTQRRRLR
jgi:hypothetical protein